MFADNRIPGKHIILNLAVQCAARAEFASLRVDSCFLYSGVEPIPLRKRIDLHLSIGTKWFWHYVLHIATIAMCKTYCQLLFSVYA